MYQEATAILLVGIISFCAIAAIFWKPKNKEEDDLNFRKAMQFLFFMFSMFIAIISIDYGRQLLVAGGASATLQASFETLYIAFITITSLTFALSLVTLLKDYLLKLRGLEKKKKEYVRAY